MFISKSDAADNPSAVEKPLITRDPQSVLVVGEGRIRRHPFSGWAGVLVAADGLDCILRREGDVLIAMLVEPYQAAEFWGRA